MLIYCDKQKLLIQAAELLYSFDKAVSTQKVAKLLVFFGKLFEIVPPDSRSKYMQGSLFALGGLLKIEAKSYLRTMQALRSSDESNGFSLPCPLFNEESEIERQEEQRVRKLEPEDIFYFENELQQVII